MLVRASLVLLAIAAAALALPATPNDDDGTIRAPLRKAPFNAKRFLENARNVIATHPQLAHATPAARAANKEPFNRFLSPYVPGDWYQTSFTIGIPGQTYWVEIDTSNSDLLVTGIDFENATDANELYDPDASSTSKQLGGVYFAIDYYGVYMGSYYSDHIEHINKGLDDEKIVVLKSAFLGGAGYPVSGRWGMSWTQNGDTIIEKLLAGLRKPIYTIALGTYDKTFPTLAGTILYGDIDNYSCDPTATFTPLIPAPSATVQFINVTDFSVGPYTDARATSAYAATASPLILLPEHAMNFVEQALKPTKHEDASIYTISCNSDEARPDLVFNIGGQPLNVPASRYVLDIGLFGDGECLLGVTTLPKANWIVLGEPFLQEWCSIYDIGANRMGFSRSALLD